MSLLTMIQEVADSLGFSEPSDVIVNTDPTVKTLLRIANKEGKSLAKRYDWQEMIKEALFTTTNANLQGTLASLASTNFEHIISNTVWDRSNSRPIKGSISKQRYAQLEGSNAAGTFSEYQIRDKSLYAFPSPGSASAQWAFFYKTKDWCQSSAGVPQSSWAADDDTGILDEDIMALGIEWRYLKSKGYDYSEEFIQYERMVKDTINQNRGHPVISLETQRISGAGVLSLPEGDWPAA